jgi:pectinesterase
MDSHIVKEGWDNWRNAGNEQTTFYAEYNSSGPGANKEERVKWAKQLTAKQRKQYAVNNILKGGDNWKPVVAGSGQF